MAKSKTPDKKTAAKSASAKAAAPPRPAVNPKLAVRVVLDAEIATLQAHLVAMKKQIPANDPRLEVVKNRLRIRQIKRVQLG
jgi:hypothetical protein